MKIYLDDERTPIEKDWIVVRNYEEFVNKINEIGIEHIDILSLDHDLDPTAIMEYHRNVMPHYMIDYNNIEEKTGMDCIKYLVDRFIEKGYSGQKIFIHSANPIGSGNMLGYMNNFFLNYRLPQICVRTIIPFTWANE
jgi:hypothetical protein